MMYFFLFPAKKDDSWMTIIFIIVMVVFSIIGWLKKKLVEDRAREAKRRQSPGENRTSDKVFETYIQGEDTVTAPVSTKRNRIRKSRRFAQEQYEERERSLAKPKRQRTPTLAETLQRPPRNRRRATAALAGENVFDALPQYLTPNQKAIVLVEIFGKPKALTESSGFPGEEY